MTLKCRLVALDGDGQESGVWCSNQPNLQRLVPNRYRTGPVWLDLLANKNSCQLRRSGFVWQCRWGCHLLCCYRCEVPCRVADGHVLRGLCEGVTFCVHWCIKRRLRPPLLMPLHSWWLVQWVGQHHWRCLGWMVCYPTMCNHLLDCGFQARQGKLHQNRESFRKLGKGGQCWGELNSNWENDSLQW